MLMLLERAICPKPNPPNEFSIRMMLYAVSPPPRWNLSVNTRTPFSTKTTAPGTVPTGPPKTVPSGGGGPNSTHAGTTASRGPASSGERVPVGASEHAAMAKGNSRARAVRWDLMRASWGEGGNRRQRIADVRNSSHRPCLWLRNHEDDYVSSGGACVSREDANG